MQTTTINNRVTGIIPASGGDACVYGEAVSSTESSLGQRRDEGALSVCSKEHHLIYVCLCVQTTTINCLTGFIPASGGDALVYGEALSSTWGMDRIRSMMGVCPQFDVLWSELTGVEHLTIYGNIKVSCDTWVKSQCIPAFATCFGYITGNSMKLAELWAEVMLQIPVQWLFGVSTPVITCELTSRYGGTVVSRL